MDLIRAVSVSVGGANGFMLLTGLKYDDCITITRKPRLW